MISINDGAVNLAGKAILKAWVLHQIGNDAEARTMVQEARALLEEESQWACPGHEEVQRMLNQVAMIQNGLMPLDSLAGKAGAEMVYFKSSPHSVLHSSKSGAGSAILQRVA